MSLRMKIYYIFLAVILIKIILPDNKPDIIPTPQQIVSDKCYFTFNQKTLISVENKKQIKVANELANLFKSAAGFVPKIVIQDKRADIIFHTKMSLQPEHYKLYIAPSYILVEASGLEGFFYAIQTLRFLLPSEINNQTQVKAIQWTVPGMIIQDGPQKENRMLLLHTPLRLIPDTNLIMLIDYMAILKMNRIHFMQKYTITPRIKKLEMYAKSKMITISSGIVLPKESISNHPYYIEQWIRKKDISDSDEYKKLLFQYLITIAENSWSDINKYPLYPP